MNLDELRSRIDDLDRRIVQLVAERVRIAREAGGVKQRAGLGAVDVARERAVLEVVGQVARDEGVAERDMQDIYKRVIALCRGAQLTTVAFQGEAGAYSEAAALDFFRVPVQTRPYESFEGVFRAVEQGEADLGIVPVENSLEGSVNPVYDLLLESSLMVCGETELRVVHCLIGSPGTRMDDIRRIYSHPQALSQCRRFLGHLGRELVPTHDTAGSVRMLKENRLLDGAAVASARAAEIYDMEVLAEGIEDNPVNYTRFFVLSPSDCLPTGADKTSIVFSIKEEPGSLYRALRKFAVRKINLTRLESRPMRHRPWEYNFYLDCHGHRGERPVSDALRTLDKGSLFLKVLGSYPRARRPVR